jgi:hypothetical protein
MFTVDESTAEAIRHACAEAASWAVSPNSAGHFR